MRSSADVFTDLVEDAGQRNHTRWKAIDCAARPAGWEKQITPASVGIASLMEPQNDNTPTEVRVSRFEFGPSLMERAFPATISPHQRRKQEGQLKADSTGWYGPDVVAGFERSSIERLSRKTGFGVAKCNSRFHREIVREEIVEAIVVHVL